MSIQKCTLHSFSNHLIRMIASYCSRTDVERPQYNAFEYQQTENCQEINPTSTFSTDAMEKGKREEERFAVNSPKFLLLIHIPATNIYFPLIKYIYMYTCIFQLGLPNSNAFLSFERLPGPYETVNRFHQRVAAYCYQMKGK